MEVVKALGGTQNCNVNGLCVRVYTVLTLTVPVVVDCGVRLEHLFILRVLFNQTGEQQTLAIGLCHSNQNVGFIVNLDIRELFDQADVDNIILILVLLDDGVDRPRWSQNRGFRVQGQKEQDILAIELLIRVV